MTVTSGVDPRRPSPARVIPGPLIALLVVAAYLLTSAPAASIPLGTAVSAASPQTSVPFPPGYESPLACPTIPADGGETCAAAVPGTADIALLP